MHHGAAACAAPPPSPAHGSRQGAHTGNDSFGIWPQACFGGLADCLQLPQHAWQQVGAEGAAIIGRWLDMHLPVFLATFHGAMFGAVVVGMSTRYLPFAMPWQKLPMLLALPLQGGELQSCAGAPARLVLPPDFVVVWPPEDRQSELLHGGMIATGLNYAISALTLITAGKAVEAAIAPLLQGERLSLHEVASALLTSTTTHFAEDLMLVLDGFYIKYALQCAQVMWRLIVDGPERMPYAAAAARIVHIDALAPPGLETGAAVEDAGLGPAFVADPRLAAVADYEQAAPRTAEPVALELVGVAPMPGG